LPHSLVDRATQDDDSVFGEVIKELDAEQSHITIRLEMRRFRKPTTVINGLSGTREELEGIARQLKKKLATGGSFKEGIVVLQGDQRDGAKELLEKLGFSGSHIEVQ
jgi:translation initiation factor 1